MHKQWNISDNVASLAARIMPISPGWGRFAAILQMPRRKL
jgi:hypothetical protein